MTEEIQLGEQVKCKITGFKGIAVARTVFINGCVQYSVAPKHEKGKNPMEQEFQIDETSLELVNKPKKIIKKNETGGPNRYAKSMKGY